MDARKYIVIPEYKPLYAMKKCFGPLHGPLMEPCLTPIDIIKELLLQSGTDQLTIYEVKFDSSSRKTTGKPVQLTKENYRLPYETLIGGTPFPEEGKLEISDPVPGPEKVVVSPIVADDKVEEETETEVEPEVEEDSTIEEASAPTNVDEVFSEMKAQANEIEPEDDNKIEEDKPAKDPFAGMTKAERRAARLAMSDANPH